MLPPSAATWRNCKAHVVSASGIHWYVYYQQRIAKGLHAVSGMWFVMTLDAASVGCSIDDLQRSCDVCFWFQSNDSKKDLFLLCANVVKFLGHISRISKYCLQMPCSSNGVTRMMQGVPTRNKQEVPTTMKAKVPTTMKQWFRPKP